LNREDDKSYALSVQKKLQQVDDQIEAGTFYLIMSYYLSYYLIIYLIILLSYYLIIYLIIYLTNDLSFIIGCIVLSVQSYLIENKSSQSQLETINNSINEIKIKYEADVEKENKEHIEVLIKNISRYMIQFNIFNIINHLINIINYHILISIR
jgi:hypothetical protein